MMRFVLAPIAATFLFAGLVPMAAASFAAARGLALTVEDPAFATTLSKAVWLAGAASLPGAALGLAGAVCLARAGAWARLVMGCAILVLVLPAPMLSHWPALPPGGPPITMADMEAAWAGPCAAIARAAALMLLIMAHPVSCIRPALRQAALCAGATPFQAWRHVVLKPIMWPLLAGMAACLGAVLAQTGAAAIVGPHLDMVDAWVLPAALLMVACSVLALGGAGKESTSFLKKRSKKLLT
jgi:ABC-type Fe3+ transport system permease subunit